MPVVASDIKIIKSSVISDATSNGGRCGTIELASNVSNNFFPNVTPAELTSGITRYRKFFARNKNSSDIGVNYFYVWVRLDTDADDYVMLTHGTDTDTQADADDYTSYVCAGTLHANTANGATSIVVDFPVNFGSAFQAGDVIRLYDGNNLEWIDPDGQPSWNGTQATITLDGSTGNDFDAGTEISIARLLGDLIATSNSWSETSVSGTYNESLYPVVLYNVGTVTDTWTLTFSSSTAFSVSGATTGYVGTGLTSSDFKPVNGSSFYFKIDKNGWGGTWANGDTVTFNTVHAGKSFWVKEVVPALTSAYSNSTFTLGFDGVSA